MLNLSNNNSSGLGLNLEQEKYYYHSVKGFNLDQLTSILDLGILSKNKAQELGKNILSNGSGLNGQDFVSVSTRLNAASYSGTHLGIIINPIGLKFFQRYGDEHISFERQIMGKIPTKHIVGITIPSDYLQENFTNSQLFYVPNTEQLKEGMHSLECFYLKSLKISLFDDKRLKLAYENALDFRNKNNQIRKDFDLLEAIEKSDNLEIETQTEFNLALMGRIKEIYKSVIKKHSYTLVDIIQFHTEMPIYFTSGELVTPLTIEEKQIKKNSVPILKKKENNPILEQNFEPYSRLWAVVLRVKQESTLALFRLLTITLIYIHAIKNKLSSFHY